MGCLPIEHWKILLSEKSKSRCLPHFLKTLKLINYINLVEIVKYFTNFTCGIGGGPIKFRRSFKRVSFLLRFEC